MRVNFKTISYPTLRFNFAKSISLPICCDEWVLNQLLDIAVQGSIDTEGIPWSSGNMKALHFKKKPLEKSIHIQHGLDQIIGSVRKLILFLNQPKIVFQ